ncbi:tellurite resistance TerB C-terminal domain-containing protein, partial [Candidatus Collinsella stercoripullorum]
PAAGAPAREDGPTAREQAGAGESVAGPLDARQRAFLSALVAGDAAGLAQAAGGASADLIADAVNEALFDLIGDTVVEFGAAGPELVEDYREDVEELLAHE